MEEKDSKENCSFKTELKQRAYKPVEGVDFDAGSGVGCGADSGVGYGVGCDAGFGAG